MIHDPGQEEQVALPMIFTPLRNASGEIRAVLATGHVVGQPDAWTSATA